MNVAACTVKNVVYYMALQNTNHTVIGVINTTQCHIIHQLVWYAHFIFYSTRAVSNSEVALVQNSIAVLLPCSESVAQTHRLTVVNPMMVT